MERLRDAIAKARATREAGLGESDRQAPRRPPRPGPSVSTEPSVPDVWETLERVQLDDARLADERIVAWKKSDPAHIAFDVLRTRLLPILAEKGWKKVLVTSPSKGCGKTTVAINLAVSLARQAAVRTLLIDLDLRTPGIGRRLGVPAGSITDWLAPDAPPHSPFMRVGDSLAVCLSKPVRNSAELLQDPRTAQRLDAAVAELDPVAVIYDTPPMLACDDALGLLPQVDCVLLVAAAGQSTAEEIEECERLLAGNTNFLGVLLNKCTQPSGGGYPYYESYGAP